MTDETMNGKPIEMKPANPHVVQALEQLLASAKLGNIHGFMAVIINADGVTGDMPVMTNAPQAVMLLGANEVLRAKIASGLLAAQQQVQRPGIVRASQVPDAAGLFRR